MPSSDELERLKVDYTETTGLVRDLADTRFKLVALVPTLSGAAVALLSRHPSAAQLLAVGALGLVATIGVVVYELRNTQVYEYAVERAAKVERELGIPAVYDPTRPGGLFGERPDSRLRLFGLAVGYERGLALVYGAAIGGWSYLFAWGALHALGVSNAQRGGGVIGVAAGLVVLVEFVRIDARPDAERRTHGRPAPHPGG